MRKDSTTGDWYACSGHFLWVGERTRQLDGAHVEFLSGLHNPVGAKVGPTMTPDELVALAERLNPDRSPGRLTLITRLGASRVQELLPPLLRAVREAEMPVVWVCDPMHANGFVTGSGHKTRRLDDVLREIEGFFAAHREVGHLARRRPSRDHRRERDGVPRRLRGRARGAARHAVRIALRPALERPPVARPRVPGRRADARVGDAHAPEHHRHRDGTDRRVRGARRAPRRRRACAAGTPTPTSSASRRSGRPSSPAATLADAVAGADLVLVAAPVAELPARRPRGARRRPRAAASSPTSARRRARSAPPRTATRGSSAGIRSAAPRRAAPSARPPSCSRARPGS